jgi:hypothetical protein
MTPSKGGLKPIKLNRIDELHHDYKILIVTMSHGAIFDDVTSPFSILNHLNMPHYYKLPLLLIYVYHYIPTAQSQVTPDWVNHNY